LWKRQFDKAFLFADWAINAIDDTPVDICIAHDSHGLEAARSIVEKTGCKLVYDGVEYPEYTGRSGQTVDIYKNLARGTNLLHLHEAEIIRKASAIIVGTEGVVEWYRKQPGVISPVVIRNCREYVRLSPDARIRIDCGLGARDKLLLFPNTVNKTCGLDECIEALRYSPDYIHIAVMGRMQRGAEKNLREKIADAPFAGRVHLLPLVSPEDLLAYRSGADAALIPWDPSIPNHFTALPNRFFEAVTSRLPLIITNLPEVRRAVEEYKCGVVIDSFNPREIAAVFREALTEERLTALKDGIEVAATELCWENERKKYLDLIKSVGPSDGPLNVVFVANKNLSTNIRCYQHSKALVELGHHVLFLALEIPYPELQVPGARYFNLLEPQQDFDGALGLLAPPPSTALGKIHLNACTSAFQDRQSIGVEDSQPAGQIKICSEETVGTVPLTVQQSRAMAGYRLLSSTLEKVKSQRDALQARINERGERLRSLRSEIIRLRAENQAKTSRSGHSSRISRL
jgi:glycosyltransferase involved in cell wall biosynthesis